jgi:photosystem II stability/assembly factor-like uncharacterized protein
MRPLPGSLVAVALLALTSSHAALGNGRFPRAQRLVEDASNPSRLAIYGTYGLLTTSDAGKTWQHVCEAATGPFAGEAPLLELLPHGKLVLTSGVGLRGATFPACDWHGLLEPVLPNSVQDITRDPSDEHAMWALLSEPDVKLGFRSALSRSVDAGESWSDREPIPSEMIGQGVTIDAAPSRAQRLYVSGLDTQRRGVLARSDDAGHTWAAFPIPDAGSDELPYLAAIDARDPDRVFVRTDALKDHQGQLEPDDALLFSADGGETFTRVLSRRAKLLGFALSPDGETLLLGYGDPVLYAYTVEPQEVGLYRLRVADLVADPSAAASKLEQIFAGSVTCLRWSERGLFGCFAQAEQGFEAGRADDAEFSLSDSKPFSALLDLKAVRPLACEESAAAAACLTDPNVGWPFVCSKLGAPCDAAAEPSGSSAEPGTSKANEPGCGCRSAQLNRSPSELPLTLLLGVAILRRFLRLRRSRAASRVDTNAR